MKIFEREEMIFSLGEEQGLRQGSQQEKANTERERTRADDAEKEVERLKDKIRKLKEK